MNNNNNFPKQLSLKFFIKFEQFCAIHIFNLDLKMRIIRQNQQIKQAFCNFITRKTLADCVEKRSGSRVSTWKVRIPQVSTILIDNGSCVSCNKDTAYAKAENQNKKQLKDFLKFVNYNALDCYNCICSFVESFDMKHM